MLDKIQRSWLAGPGTRDKKCQQTFFVGIFARDSKLVLINFFSCNPKPFRFPGRPKDPHKTSPLPPLKNHSIGKFHRQNSLEWRPSSLGNILTLRRFDLPHSPCRFLNHPGNGNATIVGINKFVLEATEFFIERGAGPHVLMLRRLEFCFGR